MMIVKICKSWHIASTTAVYTTTNNIFKFFWFKPFLVIMFVCHWLSNNFWFVLQIRPVLCFFLFLGVFVGHFFGVTIFNITHELTNSTHLMPLCQLSHGSAASLCQFTNWHDDAWFLLLRVLIFGSLPQYWEVPLYWVHVSCYVNPYVSMLRTKPAWL